jgi:gamma-glutamylcyclotransferase (GGCT)/AIG2-like uncharacterized protein YtfP
MDTLFAYGTLQHPDVMKHVLGRLPETAPARLSGYARYRMRDYDFPGIVPENDSSIDGTLFMNITPAEWERLDEYEADFYVRTAVYAHSLHGESCRAFAYVVPPHNTPLLTDESWDLKHYRPGPDSGIH